MAEDRLCPGLADPNVPAGATNRISIAMRQHHAELRKSMPHTPQLLGTPVLNTMDAVLLLMLQQQPELIG